MIAQNSIIKEMFATKLIHSAKKQIYRTNHPIFPSKDLGMIY
jgi:hypothetical protein